MPRIARLAAALAVVVAALNLSSDTALAHERRNVGPYQFVVGFIGEPAFAGTLNAVDLRITDTRANKPVEDVEKTLGVEVFHGGLTTPLALSLRARFNQPGAYAADFVPTREGSYTFRFKGKIESLDVDERFESGPNRFDEVKSMAALEYPERVLSGSELNRRLADLQSSIDQLRLIAIAALVVAVVLPLGLALRGKRR